MAGDRPRLAGWSAAAGGLGLLLLLATGLASLKESLAPLLGGGAPGPVKILTSCPSCLKGLSRYGQDLQNGLLEADYIVVEMAKHILGENWMSTYVAVANDGGIERVLV